MSKGLDLAKAEAALKRAAHKALHGTREERSGRSSQRTSKHHALALNRVTQLSRSNERLEIHPARAEQAEGATRAF